MEEEKIKKRFRTFFNSVNNCTKDIHIGFKKNEYSHNSMRTYLTDEIYIDVWRDGIEGYYYFNAKELYRLMNENNFNDIGLTFEEISEKILDIDKYDENNFNFRILNFFFCYTSPGLLNLWLLISFSYGLSKKRGQTIKSKTKTYVIISKISGLYKIGRTIDLKKRMRTLSNADPSYELVLLINGDVELELHDKFDSKRIRYDREIFRLDENDVSIIKEEYKDLILEKGG